jgi:hypothetical protein
MSARHVAIATLAALAVAVSGCALVQHPQLTLPAPPPTSSCSPENAEITTQAVRRDGLVVVHAERATVTDGSLSMPEVVTDLGVEYQPEDAFENTSASTAQWLAAIVATVRNPPPGFGDQRQIDGAFRTTAFPTFDVDAGDFALVIVAPQYRVRFDVRCDDFSVRGVIVSPTIGTGAQVLFVECNQRYNTDTVSRLAYEQCDVTTPTNGRDAEG